MAIIVKDTGNGDFQLPDSGIHNAVCSNVYDLGLQPGWQGKMQHKVVVMWELEQTIPEGDFSGKRFIVSQMYTASLSERANLRAHLESWRGRSFTEDELAGFDIEKLRGVPCTLSIVHNENKGKTYANVSAVMKHDKSKEALVPELAPDYVPEWVKNKMNDAAPETGDEGSTQKPADFEDDIPF